MSERVRAQAAATKTRRNVVASYMRDGLSQKDALREAQKWRERMEQYRAERAEATVTDPPSI